MKGASKFVLVMTVLVLLLAEAHISLAATCSPVQLSPCLGAIRSSSPPSKLCCSKIKQQKPCLCQYLKNPTLKKYVNSPGAKKVARSCGVPYPRWIEVLLT
ncbi:hypothetical protein RND71_006203 [Anisodus tanguticus]|uniref:Bifunctional inhibitor/plant lipid transfer protein/seed storage helical domain-containing protein n=1 Tax=Anisodus tanguticus TaxID=243964 RepID=A0AAE1STJ5_9SOLA|nr:hypothetical protein RND71_006203 [Anisodus tanguticus]